MTIMKRIAFTLDDQQMTMAENFMARHKHLDVHAAACDYFTYIFHPTSLGDIVKIQCNVCKEEKDISTDF